MAEMLARGGQGNGESHDAVASEDLILHLPWMQYGKTYVGPHNQTPEAPRIANPLYRGRCQAEARANYLFTSPIANRAGKPAWILEISVKAFSHT